MCVCGGGGHLQPAQSGREVHDLGQHMDLGGRCVCVCVCVWLWCVCDIAQYDGGRGSVVWYAGGTGNGPGRCACACACVSVSE